MPKATKIDSLEGLLDRTAILDVVTNYGASMDRREWELYRSLFIDDVDIHFPSWTGAPQENIKADEWVRLVRSTLGGFDSTQHRIISHIVQIDGDRATVDSHMTAKHVYSPTEVEFLGGFYTHSLIRRDGEWKLSGVKLVTAWDEGSRDLFGQAFERGSALL